MRYPCLVLDHDDTLVRTTPEINYPSFLESLRDLRPAVQLSLETFFEKSFDPGFFAYCTDELGYNAEEMEIQFRVWRKWVEKCIPDLHTGMKELLEKQKAQGGLICAVSHSGEENIRRDYRVRCGFEPDLVFGYERGEGKRKPDAFPLEEIMRVFHLKPSQLLVVDDLKPGLEMARRCGVDFAFAGWAHQVPAIENFMKENKVLCFSKVSELEAYQFG